MAKWADDIEKRRVYQREYMRWYRQNPEEVIARRAIRLSPEARAERHAALKESNRIRSSAWRAARLCEDKEGFLSSDRARCASYRFALSADKIALRSESVSRWAKTNSDKRAARQRNRQSQKLRATPAWASKSLMDSFYRMASVFGLQVDHIVPLKSKLVCGLHVQHNLQLLTREENRRKGNKLLSMDVAAPYGNGMEDERTCAALGEQDALSISATT